jgi:hypothetical protein
VEAVFEGREMEREYNLSMCRVKLDFEDFRGGKREGEKKKEKEETARRRKPVRIKERCAACNKVHVTPTIFYMQNTIVQYIS